MQFYDITRTLHEGIAVWPGDPKLQYRWIMRMRDGESCNVSVVSMSVHTGTHIDVPLHLDDSGSDVASMPISHVMGPIRVFSMAAQERIKTSDLDVLDWHGVKRVLFKTRTDGLDEDSFDSNYVYLDEDASEFLVRQRMLLVGTDAPSVDAFTSTRLRSHQILLRHGIVILEEAQLAGVPQGDYDLICLPLKLAGLDGSPVRAILCKK